MSRTSRSSVLVAAVVAVAAAVLAWMLPAPAAGATAQHAAGLVVDTGERVVTVYVEFPEETITGEELLRRADVEAVFSDQYGMGKAVCSILGVGSPKDDCFREAEQNGLYWNYSRAEGGAWQRSNRGVSSTTVEHGDVDGWAWGEQGSEPPYYSFEEIRAQHAPEPSPEPSPSPTPTAGGERSSQPEPTTPPPSEPVRETSPTGPGGTSSSVTETAAETASETASPTSSVTATTTPAVTSGARSAPDDRVTASAKPAAATAGDTGAGRGPWSLVTFLAVMAGLTGAIVWRRRSPDRSARR